MESIHIEAHWVAAEKRMVVRLYIGGQNFLETFTRARWRWFVAGLDRDPLRIAGLTIKFRGDAERSARMANGIRRYLRRVDAAFRATGATTHI